MSRLYVDRISPYQSASLTVDGYLRDTDTGSFVTITSYEADSASFDSRITSKLEISTYETDSGSFSTRINDNSANITNKLDTTSFNAYTESNDSKVDSLISETGSYATTGANTFNGNQVINGDITVEGTGSFGHINYVTGSATIIGDAFLVLNADTPTLRYAGIKVFDSGSQATASLEWDGDKDSWIVVDEQSNTANLITGPTGSRGSETDLTPNTLPKSGVDNQIVDSSITDDGTLVSIGGNLAVSGETTLSGSVKTEVAIQSITSTTASIDFSDTSLFELTLASGVDTHIDATNIGKGQTINLLITQDDTTAGTVSFSPKFLQPSGSEYTPTETLSGQDILTLMTYNDTSKIYVASTNEFI